MEQDRKARIDLSNPDERAKPGRIISVTDPEMRHDHKSQAQGFNDFKMAATTEHSSELIVDNQDIPVTGSDGQALMPTIERVPHHVGVAVEHVIGDGAYGSVANRVSQAT